MGHQLGAAHEFNTEEARIAGRKGGIARAMKRHLGTSAYFLANSGTLYLYL
jgi:hypothetical protein